MADKEDTQTRVVAADTAATIAAKHQNWRRRLMLAVGATRGMRECLERVERALEERE